MGTKTWMCRINPILILKFVNLLQNQSRKSTVSSERHIYVGEIIESILLEIKSHFQTLNELIIYHDITTRRKDVILTPIELHSQIIIEISKKLNNFISKYHEDVNIELDSQIQVFLKSISNFNFKSTKSEQFLTRSKDLIRTMDDLIKFNKETIIEYRQNEP